MIKKIYFLASICNFIYELNHLLVSHHMNSHKFVVSQSSGVNQSPLEINYLLSTLSIIFGEWLDVTVNKSIHRLAAEFG